MTGPLVGSLLYGKAHFTSIIAKDMSARRSQHTPPAGLDPRGVSSRQSIGMNDAFSIHVVLLWGPTLGHPLY